MTTITTYYPKVTVKDSYVRHTDRVEEDEPGSQVFSRVAPRPTPKSDFQRLLRHFQHMGGRLNQAGYWGSASSDTQGGADGPEGRLGLAFCFNGR